MGNKLRDNRTNIFVPFFVRTYNKYIYLIYIQVHVKILQYVFRFSTLLEMGLLAPLQ